MYILYNYVHNYTLHLWYVLWTWILHLNGFWQEAGEVFFSSKALVELVQRIRGETHLFEK